MGASLCGSRNSVIESSTAVLVAEPPPDQDDQSSEVLDLLIEFLSEPSFIRSNDDPTAEILGRVVNKYDCSKYVIPDKNIPELFQRLESCRRHGAPVDIAEVQLEYSGLVFDFDVIQSCNKTQITYDIQKKLCSEVARQVYKYINIDVSRDLHIKKYYSREYFIFLHKPHLSYDKISGQYLDNFQLRIPGIKLRDSSKRLIATECAAGFAKIFKGVKTVRGLNSSQFLDRCSITAPTKFVGCGIDSNRLDRAFEVRIKLNSSAFQCLILDCSNKFDERYNKNLNLVNELSLNWECDDGAAIIEKVEYDAREQPLQY